MLATEKHKLDPPYAVANAGSKVDIRIDSWSLKLRSRAGQGYQMPVPNLVSPVQMASAENHDERSGKPSVARPPFGRRE